MRLVLEHHLEHPFFLKYLEHICLQTVYEKFADKMEELLVSHSLSKYSFEASEPQRLEKKMVKYRMHAHTQHCEGNKFTTVRRISK